MTRLCGSSMAKKNDSTVHNNELDDLYNLLFSKIPDELKVQVKETEDNADKINEYNNKILQAYIDSENQHLEQQKPVAIIIAVVLGIQLVLFNILIYIVTLKNLDIQTRTLLLDFLKYYIGAVIVEMLGMCLIIVRGIYTLSIGKMAEHIIKKKK